MPAVDFKITAGQPNIFGWGKGPIQRRSAELLLQRFQPHFISPIATLAPSSSVETSSRLG